MSINSKELSETDIPSYEIFLRDIRRIYPEGNLDLAYKRILYHINTRQFCNDGTPITYSLIMDKFATHIKSWNMVYGSRDPKYWGKDAEEKRKTLFDFIGMNGYEREYVTSVGQSERTAYLFGDFTLDYLKEQIEQFKHTIPDETG